MKFDIGDLVDYRPSPENLVYTGIVLKKLWREDLGGDWFYKLYFIYENDQAWISENDIRNYGGYNGV